MKCSSPYNFFEFFSKKEKCSKCANKAAIFLGYANRHLCEKHFLEMFERRFRATLREFKMIKKGDKIALGLSGGKDSTTLLHVLHDLQRIHPFELLAITVDYGVSCGYGKRTLDTARKEARALGIEHHLLTFKDEIGYTLGELVEKTKTSAPCSYCGVIRRRILNNAARKLGADKLAIAHTLDDTVETFLMNLMRNEPLRLLRYTEPLISNDNFVPRIKPLIRAYEFEVVAYGRFKGLRLEEKSCCPYSKNAMRALIREELNSIEAVYPGAKLKMFKSFLSIQRILRKNINKKELKIECCKKCGEPSSTKECMYCKMLDPLH